MKAHSYQTFVSMFYALDVAFDEHETERLRSFLSDANPSTWKDGGSADPAVYAEFRKEFDKRFGEQGASPEEAMTFVRNYLDTQNHEYSWAAGNLVAAFDGIVTPKLWEQSLAETAN